MNRILSLLLCLIPSIIFAQVQTKDFTPGWATVPGPTQPLSVITNACGNFPPTLPTGNIQIAYTLVDQLDQHTAMSPVTTICPKANWNIVCNPTFVSKDSPAVAICYWYNDAGTWRILGAPTFCETPANTTRPYFPLAGWQNYRDRGHALGLTVFSDWNYNKYWWPVWTDASWKKGSAIPTPAGAPSVRVYDKALLPTSGIEVAYSWACNENESPLSSPVYFAPGAANSNYRFLELARGIIPPQGACGCYVYVRVSDGQGNYKDWHRQPVPHVTKPTTLDDYCWPLNSNIIVLSQFQASGIQPNTTTPGRSWLSGLHLALNNTGSINVTEDQEICCPLICPLSNAYGGAMDRTISAPLGAKWNITTRIVPGSPSAWPIWCENSQRTRLVGCNMSSTTATAGVALFDHSGSGAFYFSPERLNIALSLPQAAGILVTNESRSQSTHSPSDSFIRQTTIAAEFPVVLEWNQSARWTFEDLNADSNGSMASCILMQSNSGTLTVRGRFGCNNARAVCVAGSATQVTLENVFADGGFPEWIVCPYRSAPAIKVSVEGMNVRLPFLHLVTATNPASKMIVAKWSGVAGEPCNDPCTFTTRYNGISLTAEPNAALTNLAVRQPLQANWQNTRYWQEWDNGLTPTPPTLIVVP